ncbi:hypothetical protein GLOIN_2v1790369 [Rhizophagus irregularis DAOM 181602=DAOM 197198]|uniref:Uncharacterized protein n=1 Tax=Rhizophagus irregularis (strain DAOM 181602 / DAOM 197198 / MUCL 43194) TaxID=747089 RepID=A0A2P4NZ92_RHIID|nr:hypothetical protein GLOIN_2v1790369 [Rhizophagus irregularis DAOM 181602=DAOM 197198]POG58444.1 hypothetical protein GLOIN_2v1790369 [Rhizophagus irregularis DAOM 181602=DAOM 197198]|eukprot:XP_025165310.1 hypothetical protein GLOIN_2v1790369 [Rhizophagus irregularis DAOM 181602=DAOM 197198]
MEKKKIYDYRCHRCWKISERLIPWHDDDFNNELKECFARCGIKKMSSLGVCNINNKFCSCQTYMEDDNNPGKSCQKKGASCGCQTFFAVPNDRLKCKYCDNFSAFHKMTFQIVFLACLNLSTKNSWKNKSAPRKNTSIWKKMKKRGLIVEQVTFNKDDIKNFNTKIVSLFQIDIVANNIIILKALVEIRKIGNQPCQPNFGAWNSDDNIRSQFFGFRKTVSTSDLWRWISVLASNFGVRYGFSSIRVLEDLLDRVLLECGNDQLSSNIRQFEIWMKWNILTSEGTKGEFKSSICQLAFLFNNVSIFINHVALTTILALVDNSNDESSVMNIKNLIS